MADTDSLRPYEPRQAPTLEGGDQRYLKQELQRIAGTFTSTNKVISNIETPLVFASLPASPTVGMKRCITDSNTVVWGATIAGGGANKVLAWFNGTNWTVVGI